MYKIFGLFISAAILFSITSCDPDIPSEVIDQELSKFTVEMITAPQSLLFDSNDSSFATSIKLSTADGIRNIWFNCISSDGSANIGSSIPMRDDGNAANGDTTAGDGIFSGKLTMSRFDPFGNFNLEYFIETTDKLVRKVGVRKMFYDNGQHNAKPLISQVFAPDSVTVGSTTVSFIVAAEVSDSNGLADIASVWFTSTKPDGDSSGTRFFLLDNGNLDENGDANAGDGIFSLKIQLTPSNDKGIYKFDFFTEDRRQLLSEIVTHFIKVK